FVRPVGPTPVLIGGGNWHPIACLRTLLRERLKRSAIWLCVISMAQFSFGIIFDTTNECPCTKLASRSQQVMKARQALRPRIARAFAARSEHYFHRRILSMRPSARRWR